MISENVVLNERQQEICMKEGMKTEYSLLSDEQKEAIIKIDLLLNYLEEKYDKEFIYENFLLDASTNSLIARAKDDSYRRDISASMDWIEDKYVYSDTYEVEVVFSDKYKECVEEYISEQLPDAEFFTDVSVDSVDDDELAREDIYKHATSVSVSIVMANCFSSEDENIDFLKKTGSWMMDGNNSIVSFVELRTMNEDDYSLANYFNYLDRDIKDKQICKYECLTQAGKLRIEGPY